MSQQIKLTDIRFSGTNARVKLDRAAVAEYRQEFEDGSPFPAIAVYHELAADGHDIYWLGDGWHRITAAAELEHETIAAEVVKGSKRAALEHSLKSNWHHGVKRTVADKRRAVDLVMADDVWKAWSARQIAALCGVSHSFVAELTAFCCDCSTSWASRPTSKPRCETSPRR
jgi:uncharacterized ParB-like nuclease family protein